ncbi:hypothetical protein I3V23_04200 [Rhodobacterales bacterium HKCCA1288]|nr:hypothetical protein I3V23_04200 [Rhodobacterales bacterium HKCCA1288]
MIEENFNLCAPLVLIVPVYQGGKYFYDCLRSISGCVDAFDLIVISFNGETSSSDYSHFKQSRLEEKYAGKFLALRSLINLNSIDHMRFICSSITPIVDPKSRIMLLAHDDLLVEKNLCSLNKDTLTEPNSLFIGDYYLFRDDATCAYDDEKLESSILSGHCHKTMSKFEWHKINSEAKNSHMFTNMSGMVFDFCVLRDLCMFLGRMPGTVNCRLEYMLAAHRSVKKISNCFPPIVSIREHAGQFGKRVSRLEYGLGEIRYSLWLYINCRSLYEFISTSFSLWGVLGFLRGFYHVIISLFIRA